MIEAAILSDLGSPGPCRRGQPPQPTCALTTGQMEGLRALGAEAKGWGFRTCMEGETRPLEILTTLCGMLAGSWSVDPGELQ